MHVVSALLLVSSMGISGLAQDVGNGENGGNVIFDPNLAKIPEIPSIIPENVTIMGDANDIPPIDSVNFGEVVNNPNKNDPVVIPDNDKEEFTCTETIDVTVTADSTLPYCDETDSSSPTDSSDPDSSDTESSVSDDEESSSDRKSKSAAPSHCMSAVYAVAIAAALAVVNVAFI
ncbi:hypothetical protein GGH95_002103 [Coemansia sp. RSA 1836]|nr:hypothetical protein GGH95_002103 [Coemansia sp. RSA 1836]